jgi:hypothetical protein
VTAQLAFHLARRGQQRSAAKHRAEIDRLLPMVKELVAQRGSITVDDIRLEGSRRNLLNLHSEGRALSFLGVLMREAGLVSTGQRVRSHIPATHGNLRSVWRLP